MRRRRYLGLVGASTAVALAGCTGVSTGTLATRVSDQPGDIGDFESVVITTTELRTIPADTDDDVDEMTRRVDAEVDLVDLQGDSSAPVGEAEFETGEYQYLKLVVGAVDATLSGGEDATVTTPGEAPLQFNTTFEIRAGETTTFTADFTPVRQGQSGSYVLQPVAEETTVSYESSDDGTGDETG
jgi:uncharacterized protein YaiE (UPF0345 family)